jgi:putative hydrolase of the HAD superfamily
MRPDSPALLLDLDDTLYPHRRFRTSGFAAVARHLAQTLGLNESALFRQLLRASREGNRGKELDLLLRDLSVPVTLESLVDVIRSHQPVLRLSVATVTTLKALRATWRLAIVTNGLPEVQARKVEALGLAPLVDTVVFAADFGSGRGKPEPEPFVEALRRLGVPAERAVFVGDDEEADIAGAFCCGLLTIRSYEWRRPRSSDVESAADAVVRCLADVPSVAGGLLERKLTENAA